MQYILQDIPIGANIARLRRAQGLTQEQVVARVQLQGSAMSRATYSKIETGKRNIKASDLLALQRVFDVSMEAFFQEK